MTEILIYIMKSIHSALHVLTITYISFFSRHHNANAASPSKGNQTEPTSYSALCAVARDENRYIREWVEYHRCMGEVLHGMLIIQVSDALFLSHTRIRKDLSIRSQQHSAISIRDPRAGEGWLRGAHSV